MIDAMWELVLFSALTVMLLCLVALAIMIVGAFVAATLDWMDDD